MGTPYRPKYILYSYMDHFGNVGWAHGLEAYVVQGWPCKRHVRASRT